MEKGIFRFLVSAVFAAMLLTACNNEETLLDNNVPIEKGKLSFVLPIGANRTVTYADVAGEPSEYALHNIRVYWFTDDNNRLYKQFGWGDGVDNGGMMSPGPSVDPLSLHAGSNQTVVTISVGDYDSGSKFFIVANVNGDTIDMASSKALKDVNSSTTLQQFQALLSDAIATSNGDLKLLSTPLPMSIGKSAASNTSEGYIAVAKPATVGVQDNIPLKRRVARFDVRNTADYSNFEIKNIIVSRAQTQVMLCDSAFDRNAPYASQTGKFKVPAGARANDPYAFNGPPGSGVHKAGSEIDSLFEQGEPLYNEREHLTKAAFYLYPTHLDSTNLETEIVIEGIFKQTGTPKLYKLNIPTAGIDVEANKIYVINVVREHQQNIKINLEILHWDEQADSLHARRPDHKVVDWGELTSSANSTLKDSVEKVSGTNFYYEYASSVTQPDTLKFTTMGSDMQLSANDAYQHVTNISFVPRAGGAPYNQSDMLAFHHAKIISKTTLTYGAVYTTEHQVILPPTDAPIDVVMQIFDPVDPHVMKTVNIRSYNYAKTGYKPVKIKYTAGTPATDHYVLWAPVNVGADSLPDKKESISSLTGTTNGVKGTKIAGLLFQWGRNKPGLGANISNPTTTTTMFNSVEEALASNLWYISNLASTLPGNWLTNAANDSLWGVGEFTIDYVKKQGPCPAGWEVPTRSEWDNLISSVNTSLGTGWYIWKSKADPTEIVYLPMSGTRQTTGTLSFGTMGDYWCADMIRSGGNQGRPNRVYIQTNGSVGPDTGDPWYYGEAVRAIRTIIPVDY
jgi:uncharacterized protein (TIGR02145 family)